MSSRESSFGRPESPLAEAAASEQTAVHSVSLPSSLSKNFPSSLATRVQSSLWLPESSGLSVAAPEEEDAVFSDRVNRILIEQYAQYLESVPLRKSVISEHTQPIMGRVARPNPNAFDLQLWQRLGQNLPNLGYSYVIRRNGDLITGRAQGRARGLHPQDGGTIWHSTDQPTHLASSTKALTAAAVLHAIENTPGVDLETAIWKFFPLRWVKKVHPLFMTLTFGRCLSFHTTISTADGALTDVFSIRSWYLKAFNGINGMSIQVPKIFDPPTAKNRIYNNVSFAWMRFVLFHMAGPQDFIATLENALKNVGEDKYATVMNGYASMFYRDYVQKHLLLPSGVSNSNLSPIPSDPTQRTLYYRYPPPNPALPGAQMNDWTLIAGGGGWFMSTSNLSKFWGHLRFGTVVSANVKKQLFPPDGAIEKSYGLEVASTTGGFAYWRVGEIGDQPNEWGCYTAVLDYPGAIQLTFSANHNITQTKIGTWLTDAYKASWM